MSRLLSRHRAAPWLSIGLALLTLAACDRLGGQLFDKPELRFERIGISNLSLDGLTLTFKISVRNPNRFPMELRNWDYTVSLNGVELPEERHPGEARISAKSARTITIPVQVSYTNLAKILKRAVSRLQLAYVFQSTVDAATWLGKRSVSFTTAGQLEVPGGTDEDFLEDLAGEGPGSEERDAPVAHTQMRPFGQDDRTGPA